MNYLKSDSYKRLLTLIALGMVWGISGSLGSDGIQVSDTIFGAITIFFTLMVKRLWDMEVFVK